ncbi:uncharacterized protein LOC108744656 [Agrilus planipennis]|uniref:Uncharacterized protein LOC108744656 n=1 Tax=Agrilus planipennis TaxID=224129 RepID=A0A1W4XUC5_AGRPL|nr:uncharacterized protein LOC108744656 [Agrilus planipennis]
MTDRPEEWSLHAHVTITHPGINDLTPTPQTRTERDENGSLRMVYTWTSDPLASETKWNSSTEPQQNPFQQQEQSREYRKGNIIFTSVPPRRNAESQPKFYQKDSGYSSELLSPTSFASSSLPRKPVQQPYNRRCRSTCSIVLSTTFHQDQQPSTDDGSHCTRTHSLRCQTPNAKSDNRCGAGSNSSFYGCGDPWCHHSTYREDSASRFSPLRETAEEDETTSTCPSSKRPSRANTYTYTAASSSGQSFLNNNRVIGKLKDACVQTTEVVDKCTSPLIPASGFGVRDDNAKKNARRRAMYATRTKTEPIYYRADSSVAYTPDSLEPNESSKKVATSNSAKVKRRTPVTKQKKSTTASTDSKSSEPSKKPRTVHIDVYCTGTDIESGSSSEFESENKSTSTPQTVFENERMRVTHAQASDKALPHKMINDLHIDQSRKAQEDTDNDDDISTAYPSRISSYSRFPSLSSFASGFPLSWSAYSTSSCAVPDNDYDSIANTSWKDTFSDIDSLKFSKSSLANAESTDFIPRSLRCQKSTDSIEEAPELEQNSSAILPSDSFEYIDNLKKKRQQLHKIGISRLSSTEEQTHGKGKSLDNSSQASLQPSDSFEYANSEDRRRIKTMEEIWKNKSEKPTIRKTPRLEKKHIIQQQKMKDYFNSRMSDKSLTKEETESDSSSSERGWTFDKDDDKKLERDVTVRRASKESNKTTDRPQVLVSPATYAIGSAPPLRTPSFVAFQQRLKFDPTLKAPFTLLPGVYTDPRSVAKRFGSVVDAFKKPGHHIGPAKNPHCSCDHCKRFFESLGTRGRAMSTGDVSRDGFLMNWKQNRHASQPRDS